MLNLVFSTHRAVWLQLHTRRQRLPHAILLHGPAGLGKGDFARAVAGALLCEHPHETEGTACGHCPACVWFVAGNHPDFRSLQPTALSSDGEGADSTKKKPSREITIDQVRSLEDFLQVGAHRQGRRIVLIDPAEAMNRNTANALLKSLEEPGEGALFLLVTHRHEQLLPTIRSRCQALAIRPPPEPESLAWLAAHGIDHPEHWLSLAGGAPVAAAALAGDRALRELNQSLQKHLSAGPQLAPVDVAADLDKQLKGLQGGEALYPMRGLIDAIQRWCIDLAQVRAGLPARYHRDRRSELMQLAAGTTLGRIVRYQRQLVGHLRLSEHPLNSKLFLEEVLMQYRAAFSGESSDGR